MGDEYNNIIAEFKRGKPKTPFLGGREILYSLAKKFSKKIFDM